MDSRQRVAIVVAHELAHQWFGNLVVRNRSFVYSLLSFDLHMFRLWIGGRIYVREMRRNGSD